MENVFIDPGMFMLADESEIAENIDFFYNVIKLSNSGRIIVCLYKELLEQICMRQISPFPVDINKVRDKELKEKLLLLNHSFSNSIMNHYREVDIDSCSGLQEFCTDRDELADIDEYYVFFNMLLSACYLSFDISDKVLVGNKNQNMSKGEQVNISCSCKKKTFERYYIWVSPDDYLTEQQKAVRELGRLLQGKNWFVKSPETKKGDHHNHIQEQDFSCYEQLSAKNKRVLNYLRHFGLFRIVFARFEPDTSCEVGSIKVVKVETTAESDIMTGWFYGCVDYRIQVELYFPKEIGHLLQTYAQNELSRMKMEELKTELVL